MTINQIFFVIILHTYKCNAKYCHVSGDDPANYCFNKEVLLTMGHSSHQLAVDTISNTLYFSYDSGDGKYIPAILKIDNKELSILKGVKDAFAISYDSVGKEIFFGGTHGIYRFDSMKKTLKHLNIRHLDIWWLFVKNHMFFVKFPSLNTYTYQNSTVLAVPGLINNVVQQFVMDMDNNIFFINESGLHGMAPNGKPELVVRDSPRYINMAVDNEGYVYLCSDDGVYVIRKIVNKIKKIINIHGVLGFAFDKFNNIIYSDSREIVRLRPASNAGRTNVTLHRNNKV